MHFGHEARSLDGAWTGETKEATNIADHPFSADFAAGGKLDLRVSSGEVHEIGTDANKISVKLTGRKA